MIPSCKYSNLYILSRSIISAVLCVAWSINLHAQHNAGWVFDSDRIPIQGAYILNMSSGEHEHSNNDGRFEFQKLSIGDSLLVAHYGYDRLEIRIKSLQQPLEIELVERPVSFEEVVITPDVDVLSQLVEIEQKINPVQSSQEILQRVPGLFIGQHAGGGKAEQIFLRGFDVDHGTDVRISVDGMPVNLVSHAHGQGYADLHFLIPEVVESIDFGKGPYYADQGDFNTAGYVNFRTKKRIRENVIKLEGGQFNTHRLTGILKVLNRQNDQLYVATQFLLSDGPFESEQNLDRLNVMASYSGIIAENHSLTVRASHFQSEWDASGQIPTRAVESGSISRFGAIDDTEGGQTQKSSITAEHSFSPAPGLNLRSRAFYSLNEFELYSNFTFFLRDSVNGDQIRQRESRNMAGADFTVTLDRPIGKFRAGLQHRSDWIDDNELSYTKGRDTTLSRVRYGDVGEHSVSAFTDFRLVRGKWSFVPGIRADFFHFQYFDGLSNQEIRRAHADIIVSPKLNILYSAKDNVQLYFKSGKGFHSNDARVVLNREATNTIPDALGIDLGTIIKPGNRTFINAALWYLHLEQEFVYVGDEGVIEPSGQTRRIGIEVGGRHQLLEWLFADVDISYTLARSMDSPADQAYIPLAPEITVVSGLSVNHSSGYSGSLRFRMLGDRPANEDNSIIAGGYSIFDLSFNKSWERFLVGMEIRNLLNTRWNETQFATESRLYDEVQPVEEIHFTPGTPFYVQLRLQFSW